MDAVAEKRPAEVAKDVFRGLKLIWFSKRPGFLVGPLTLLFFVFIIVFGGTKLILYVYLEVKNRIFFSLTYFKGATVWLWSGRNYNIYDLPECLRHHL